MRLSGWSHLQATGAHQFRTGRSRAATRQHAVPGEQQGSLLAFAAPGFGAAGDAPAVPDRDGVAVQGGL